jgi:hypothetical protein
MAGNWSRIECELIVEDYLNMLAAECRFEKFNKTEHRNALKEQLPARSDGSIEFKHQNISAVLIRAGHAYIRGYKPAWNYQDLLETVVLDRISSGDRSLVEIEASLIEQTSSPTAVENTNSIIAPPPERIPEKRARETGNRTPRRVNYAERETRNRRLGESGEKFVLEFERMRLAEIGRDDLVRDIEWTSKEKGDGTGYDIRSFQDDTDKPYFIEVKTTNSGKYQPFMISANEVAFSDKHLDEFALYRVFEFSRSPHLFILDGAVSNHVNLNASVFQATF